MEANLEFKYELIDDAFVDVISVPEPDTVHNILFQGLPQYPAEAVGSMTMSSQDPIVVEVDRDTSGITGLSGAVTATVEAFA